MTFGSKMTDISKSNLFRDLIDYGSRYLSVYRDHVNDLNVFPVPDGDTGSNMLLTLNHGLNAIKEFEGEFEELVSRFAEAVVFGARGNSGVILSQFFKGFSGVIVEKGDIDVRSFSAALDRGVEYAYKSVAKPVEGTMLTVMREASARVHSLTADEAVSGLTPLLEAFISEAKRSLDSTPDLLPVLKAAGVIDSGGAGFIYIFEGMLKYLNNEQIAAADRSDTVLPAAQLDLSAFDEESKFPLGYCTEVLIQLQNGKATFDRDRLVDELSAISESIVVSEQGTRVKIHAHSLTPERVLESCHAYGEFLTLKIENMTVQHTETHKLIERSPEKRSGRISVVCTADDRIMREKFFEMGADVVINAGMGVNPSSKDFMDACALAGGEGILVFPNCKNSIFAANQAVQLMDRSDVFVIETSSPAQCYAALSIMDYESDSAADMAREASEVTKSLRIVRLSRAVKDSFFGDDAIKKGDCIALCGDRLLSRCKSLVEAAVDAANEIDEEEEFDVITLFFGARPSQAEKEELISRLGEAFPFVDTDVIDTGNELYSLVMSFE